jgi:hypothetical protein
VIELSLHKSHVSHNTGDIVWEILAFFPSAIYSSQPFVVQEAFKMTTQARKLQE